MLDILSFTDCTGHPGHSGHTEYIQDIAQGGQCLLGVGAVISFLGPGGVCVSSDGANCNGRGLSNIGFYYLYSLKTCCATINFPRQGNPEIG